MQGAIAETLERREKSKKIIVKDKGFLLPAPPEAHYISLMEDQWWKYLHW